jgi:hypothetical protein
MNAVSLGNSLAVKSAFVGFPQALNPSRIAHRESSPLPARKNTLYPGKGEAGSGDVFQSPENHESTAQSSGETLVRISPGLVARIDDAYRKQKSGNGIISRNSRPGQGPSTLNLSRMLELEYRQQENGTPLYSRRELREAIEGLKYGGGSSSGETWKVQPSRFDAGKAAYMRSFLGDIPESASFRSLDLVA